MKRVHEQEATGVLLAALSATNEPLPPQPRPDPPLAVPSSKSTSFITAASLLAQNPILSSSNATNNQGSTSIAAGSTGSSTSMRLPSASIDGIPPSTLREFCAGGITEFAAIVISAEEPVKSRGTDYVMKMMVADDSKETHDDPDMFVRVFCLDPNLLPKVAAPGDIVLFKDVRSERYNNRAASKVRTLRNGSKLTVFRCPQPNSVDQIWPKGQSIAISVKERSRILALWEFHHTPPVDGPSKNPSLPISPIKPKISRQASNTALLATIPSETVFATIPDALKQEAGRLNVIGQVRKIFHPRESTSFIVVVLWDGTGERARSAPIDAKLPPYGASLPIRFWSEFFSYFDADHGEIREGMWIACLGLVAQVYHDTPEIKSKVDTQLVVLEQSDSLVKEREVFIENRNRMAGVVPLNPGQWIMVNPQAINIPISTIQQIRDFPHDCYIFRLRARVTGYAPPSMNDSTDPFCPMCEQRPSATMPGQFDCEKCNKIGPAEWKFLVRLLLEDESTKNSAPLEVLVHSFGREFFREFIKEGAVPDMNAPSSYIIADMMNALFFRTMKAMRGEQDICVFAYTVPDDSAGSRRAYQVCHSSVIIQRNES